MVFTYIHRGILDGSVTFAGGRQDPGRPSVGLGEPYTFGFDPVELARISTARNLILIEDVGASTYRERFLIPLGRGQEQLSEFQRAALAEVAGQRERGL